MTQRRPARVIAVLGMHRGGTSASMRALMTLGVECGGDLLPGLTDQNPRGFFEDEPVLEFCERALDALGLRWDSNELIPDEAWRNPALAPIELAAAESIRTRFEDVADWGVKNPRLARLLPFWRRVFARVGRKDSYLIVVRNPISVARSLQARNGTSTRQANLSWLLHMTDAVVHSKGRPRVGIDFDELLVAPAEHLDRVARALDLPGTATNPEALERFRDDFLSDALRSTQFDAADLEIDEATSGLAVRAYGLLRRWAVDDDDRAAAQLQRGFTQIRRTLEQIAPLLTEVTDLELRRRDLEEGLDERTDQVRSLESTERAHGEELERRHVAIRERDLQLAVLAAQVDGDRRDRAEARARADHLATELDATRTNAADVLGRLEAAQAVSAETHAQLEAARLEAAASADALRDSQAAFASLQGDLQQATERLNAVRIDLDAAGREREIANAARTRADGDRQEIAQRLAATQTELARVRTEGRVALDAAASALRARETSLETEIADATRRAEEATETVATLQGRLGQAEDESRRLATLAATQRDENVDWVHVRTAHLAHQLIDGVHALEKTRTWRLSAVVQRGVSRIRRRTWVDGLAQLERVARALHWKATEPHRDVRDLAGQTTLLRDTLAALTQGEIFRLSNRAALLSGTLRGRKRTDGPLQILRGRSAELLSFLEQLSVAPFETHAPVTERAAARAEPGLHGPRDATVDVIVPVFGAPEATLRCLDSVLSSRNRTPFELVVIDDCTTDRALRQALSTLAQQGRITLLTNEFNRGFPATANRGMALHPARDVVLLNSDTAVHGDWLDRLRRRAHADWKVATVTPFSNNAEICSYPMLCQAGDTPDEPALADLDAAVARVNSGLAVTLPTAVGFCMYVRREAIREVGDFDAEQFERGYGEENDFCLRARERGYQHLLAADVFVAHAGGASFSDEKASLIARGLEKLDVLHPGYRAEIETFIAADPVRTLRRRIDAERLGVGPGSLLMVSHAMGGGTERHVGELTAHLEDEATCVILMRPDPSGLVQLSRVGQTVPKNLLFDPLRELDEMAATLRQLNVRHVHYHHTLGIDSIIRRLPAELDVPYDVTLHDYLSVCPRVHCVDDSGTYCGIPEAEQCTACVKRNGSVAGFEVDVPSWRDEHAEFLSSARRVIVPNEDVVRRLSAHLPRARWLVRPHPETRSAVARPKPRKPGRSRRVAVLGAVGLHKGSAVLLACARDAARRKLPLEFCVLGYTDRDDELRATGKVTISGAYEETELARMIERARCHFALFPVVWPETYCYTLSAAFDSGLFPVAFELGAVAERIRGLGWGELLPLETDPGAVNDFLLQCQPSPFPDEPDRDAATEREAPYGSYLDDYYDGLEV